jgi:hypothetical protein
MQNKFFLAVFTASVMSFSALHASAISFSNPADIARKQERLSQEIAAAYAQHKDLSGVIRRLEEQQSRLKNSIHDPEISNLLDFLQLCLENIKTISTKPRTSANREMIADLGSSIGEGSRYIINKLR